MARPVDKEQRSTTLGPLRTAMAWIATARRFCYKMLQPCCYVGYLGIKHLSKVMKSHACPMSLLDFDVRKSACSGHNARPSSSLRKGIRMNCDLVDVQGLKFIPLLRLGNLALLVNLDFGLL